MRTALGVPVVVAALAVACGSFLAEPETDSPPGREAGGDGPTPADDGATGNDGGGSASAPKNCSTVAPGAFYCEDFAKTNMPGDIVPDGGELTTFGKAQINGPPGDFTRMLQLSADAAEIGGSHASTLLVARFFTPPPPRIRLTSRVRLDTPLTVAGHFVDTLSVGLPRDDDAGTQITQIFTRIVPGRIILGEYDSTFPSPSERFALPAEGGELTPNAFHEVRLEVDVDGRKADLFVDGTAVASLKFTSPSAAHTRFDITYGLYSPVTPRPAFQVVIDDVEGRAF